MDRPQPGQELLRQRVRVSFDFDVTCNNSPIVNSRNTPGIRAYDMALLQSFLVADKQKVLALMVETIGSQLGLNSPETFVERFLPQNNADSHDIFDTAIEQLTGDTGEYWGDVAQDESGRYIDLLSACTVEITECFNAEFVSSGYEAIGPGTPEEVHAAALSDPDAQPLTKEELAQMRPRRLRKDAIQVTEGTKEGE